jgi:hypothetical protein
MPLPTPLALQAPVLAPSDPVTSPAGAGILATSGPAGGLADDAPRSLFPSETVASQSDGAGSGSGESAPPTATSSGHAAKPPAAPSIDPGERRAGVALRHMLRDLGGCVATLPADDGRVLLLRANLGGRQARPRRRVAALAAMSVAAVRAAERRAVSELRQAHERGACENGSGLDGTTPVASSEIAAASSEMAAGQSSAPGSGSGPANGTGAVTTLRGAGAAPATTAAALPVARHRASGSPLPQGAVLALLGLVGGLLTAVVGWEVLKAVRPGWRYERSLGRSGRYPTLPLVDDAPALPPVPEEQRADQTPSPFERRPDQRPRRRHPVQGGRRGAGQQRPGGGA